MGFAILVVTLALLYISPTLIASHRKHKNIVPIAIINICFGWTFIGWVASLAWSFSSNVTLSQA